MPNKPNSTPSSGNSQNPGQPESVQFTPPKSHDDSPIPRTGRGKKAQHGNDLPQLNDSITEDGYPVIGYFRAAGSQNQGNDSEKWRGKLYTPESKSERHEREMAMRRAKAEFARQLSWADMRRYAKEVGWDEIWWDVSGQDIELCEQSYNSKPLEPLPSYPRPKVKDLSPSGDVAVLYDMEEWGVDLVDPKIPLPLWYTYIHYRIHAPVTSGHLAYCPEWVDWLRNNTQFIVAFPGYDGNHRVFKKGDYWYIRCKRGGQDFEVYTGKATTLVVSEIEAALSQLCCRLYIAERDGEITIKKARRPRIKKSAPVFSLNPVPDSPIIPNGRHYTRKQAAEALGVTVWQFDYLREKLKISPIDTVRLSRDCIYHLYSAHDLTRMAQHIDKRGKNDRCTDSGKS